MSLSVEAFRGNLDLMRTRRMIEPGRRLCTSIREIYQANLKPPFSRINIPLRTAFETFALEVVDIEVDLLILWSKRNASCAVDYLFIESKLKEHEESIRKLLTARINQALAEHPIHKCGMSPLSIEQFIKSLRWQRMPVIELAEFQLGERLRKRLESENVKPAHERDSLRNEMAEKGEKDEHPKKRKKSTVNGEAPLKIIAMLLVHHQYDSGSIGNFAPIGVNELATKASVAPSSVSKFFTDELGKRGKGDGGWSIYRGYCMNSTNKERLIEWLVNAIAKPWRGWPVE